MRACLEFISMELTAERVALPCDRQDVSDRSQQLRTWSHFFRKILSSEIVPCEFVIALS